MSLLTLNEKNKLKRMETNLNNLNKLKNSSPFTKKIEEQSDRLRENINKLKLELNTKEKKQLTEQSLLRKKQQNEQSLLAITTFIQDMANMLQEQLYIKKELYNKDQISTSLANTKDVYKTKIYLVRSLLGTTGMFNNAKIDELITILLKGHFNDSDIFTEVLTFIPENTGFIGGIKRKSNKRKSNKRKSNKRKSRKRKSRKRKSCRR